MPQRKTKPHVHQNHIDRIRTLGSLMSAHMLPTMRAALRLASPERSRRPRATTGTISAKLAASTVLMNTVSSSTCVADQICSHVAYAHVDHAWELTKTGETATLLWQMKRCCTSRVVRVCLPGSAMAASSVGTSTDTSGFRMTEPTYRNIAGTADICSCIACFSSWSKVTCHVHYHPSPYTHQVLTTQCQMQNLRCGDVLCCAC